MSHRPAVSLLAVLMFGLAGAVPANAASVTVLWLEASGSVTPSVVPMTELSGTTKVTLAGEAKVRFYHLGACKAVAVVGGVLEIGPLGYRVSGGGKIVEEQPRRCPERVVLQSPASGTQVFSGLVLRGGSSPAQPANRHEFSARPSFKLVGEQAARAARLVVAEWSDTGAGLVWAVLTVSGRRAEWPAEAKSLVAERPYALRIYAAGGTELAAVLFSASPPGAVPGLDILQVD